MKDLPAPCHDCAFRRDSVPGHLGGSEPEVYIGQCRGPFYIPCHLTYDKVDDALRENLHWTGGCAGSAVFRANLGWDSMMPPGINKLPADHDAVFSTPEEFIAHHRQISLLDAKLLMILTSPEQLLRIELVKAQVRLLRADRQPIKKRTP